MRLLWAFFKRDAAIALSYRFSFVMQFVGNLVLVALIYYIGKTLGPQGLPQLSKYGGNFLSFALIGVALTDCVIVSLVSFANQIREAQTTGTFEATLMSPLPLPLILIYSSLWNYFIAVVRFIFFVSAGVLLFGMNLRHARPVPAIVIFLLTVFCFIGIGMAWAAIVLIIKRGESIMVVVGYVILTASGVFFPVTQLPRWLQGISNLIPLTHGLDGMRAALLTGADIHQLLPLVLLLTVFSTILMGIGILAFNLAVNAAKRAGSLTQY